MASTAIVFDGWTLATDGEEPRVRDLDLADRLGYDRPRKVRELIDRMIGIGEISDVHVRPTVGRTSMPRGGERETTVNEFWLTEEQALLVSVSSQTPRAMEVRKALVKLFVAFRKGQLGPSADRDELLRVTLRLAPVSDRDRTSVWEPEMKSELARLLGHKWDGTGREPRCVKFAYGKTWEIILGPTAYGELRKRNPRQRAGTLNWQWLQEDRFRLVRAEDLRIALILARRCGGSANRNGRRFRKGEMSPWRQYMAEMRAAFKRSAAHQLALPIGA